MTHKNSKNLKLRIDVRILQKYRNIISLNWLFWAQQLNEIIRTVCQNNIKRFNRAQNPSKHILKMRNTWKYMTQFLHEYTFVIINFR